MDSIVDTLMFANSIWYIYACPPSASDNRGIFMCIALLVFRPLWNFFRNRVKERLSAPLCKTGRTEEGSYASLLQSAPTALYCATCTDFAWDEWA